MSQGNFSKAYLFSFILLILLAGVESGTIKDLFNKITSSSNSSSKSGDLIEQSAPICGSSIFSSSDKGSLSPEIIFITNRASRSEFVEHGNRDREDSQDGSSYDRERKSERRGSNQGGDLSEVAREYRFNAENVTLQDLERHGFNPEAPVTFLMHGFTSGYPLQAWISAIVESYTIDRESGHSHGNFDHSGESYETDFESSAYRKHDSSNETSRRRGSKSDRRPSSGKQLRHNLFIVNWNYAARGIVYPRAVANIPTVASYITRFINEKLLNEARVDPRRVQLIGHSLGAHLAGFIGKNTKSPLGRIYGLDPAGPCFGAISGSLYPSSNRLAPSDAEEVITIHTNTALLGIDKPIGRYSVFVEGGSVQPGCKGGGVFKSIGTLTWDGGDFDTIACSHSRAPNLLTYQHDQTDSDDDCQLVAYECKDWESFLAGHCGNCRPRETQAHHGQPSSHSDDSSHENQDLSPRHVECLRIGLDWQYPSKQDHTTESGSGKHRETEWQRPTTSAHDDHSHSHHGNNDQRGTSPSRRPYNQHSTSSYHNSSDDYSSENESGSSSTRRPNKHANGHSSSHERNRRASSNSSEPAARRAHDEQSSVEPKSMFLRTGDTQPYCTYQYQVVLELQEPFEDKKPPMSLVLQDSETENERRRTSSSVRRGQNSLSSDEFGNKFNDKVYAHLLTSNRKLKKVDHGTLLFRNGLTNGYNILKRIHVNYMSHSDPKVRQRLSSSLCLAKTDTNTGRGREAQEGNRFYFEPCSKELNSNSHNNHDDRQTSRRPVNQENSNY